MYLEFILHNQGSQCHIIVKVGAVDSRNQNLDDFKGGRCAALAGLLFGQYIFGI